MIDRAAFFAEYRSIFGKLHQVQVDGLCITIDLIDKHPWPSVEDTAYYLATKLHECAATWWPIEEAGAKPYFEKYEPHTPIGRSLGNVTPGDGYRYRGRGDVMLTGLRNYKWAQEFTGFPLVSYPAGMRWPELAYAVTQEGMITGAFTGRKLCDYPGDHVQKRRCVNGLDRADLIAGYAAGFEKILEGCSCDAGVGPVPQKPAVTMPVTWADVGRAAAEVAPVIACILGNAVLPGVGGAIANVIAATACRYLLDALEINGDPLRPETMDEALAAIMRADARTVSRLADADRKFQADMAGIGERMERLSVDPVFVRLMAQTKI